MKKCILFSFSIVVTGALFAASELEKKPAADTKPAATGEAGPPTAEQLDFFEKKIRPVLSDKCYKCHSEKAAKVKGGLVLDTREGIRRGGDSGPAVVPGNLGDSILIEAIHYTNKDFAMPPEKSGGKLPDAVIKDFEAWVKMGAPDPRDGPAAVVKKYTKEDAKNWWAFQPPQAQKVPAPMNAAWARGDIDCFLLSALDAKGLKPVADADPATILRRLYFDLTGLPPSPRDVGEFFNDWKAAGANPQAVVARWVDKLLASPQFGERWGRHWLDVARYAESSGKDVNIAFPNAWRYRDYVIASFNADKPYDQFLREQIAGDLLPASNDRQRAEQIVATGFLAIGPKGLSEQNPRQFCLDLADEQLDTVSQAILGMTIACARCHDHKFDPISQREYYGLAGIFLSSDTMYGTATGIQNRHSTELIELPPGSPVLGKTLPPADRAQMEQKLADLKKEQRELFQERFRGRMSGDAAKPNQGTDQLRVLRLITQIGGLETSLKNFDETGHAKALAMGTKELPAAKSEGIAARFGDFLRRGPQARLGRPPEFSSIGDSALYARGEADKPTERVPRGFPAVLTSGTGPAIPKTESGRRQLAEWMTSASNPLTSRVMANRVWHGLFGRGLVESVDNFGTTGKKPSNQALLDFLAVKFQTSASQGGYGWSVKRLVRDIVLSHAYQLSSEYEPASFAADPENAMVWRMSKRRLDAECIRDAMLLAGQQLELTPPVGSLLAESGDGPIGGPRFRQGVTEEQLINSGTATKVRSVYLPIVRDVPPDALAVFDFSDPNLVNGARDSTNVPSQALFILNGDLAASSSRKLAERVMAAFPAGASGGVGANLDQRVALAYWVTLGRSPTQNERTAAWNFFQKFPSNWSKGDKSAPGIRDAEDVKAAWTSFCRALFATSDFRYLN